MVLNLTLLDPTKGEAIHRLGSRVKGQSVEAAFDLIDGLLVELAKRDVLVAEKLVKDAQPTVVETKSWAFSVGVRADADFVGVVLDGAPAVMPAVTAHFQDGVFGAAAAFVIGPLPGVRAEVRVVPLPGLKARPYLGAGAVLFGPAFGLRGCLGVLGKVGPLQLFLDLGVEGFLSGPARFHALALLHLAIERCVERGERRAHRGGDLGAQESLTRERHEARRSCRDAGAQQRGRLAEQGHERREVLRRDGRELTLRLSAQPRRDRGEGDGLDLA
jgi:hypothetical protein